MFWVWDIRVSHNDFLANFQQSKHKQQIGCMLAEYSIYQAIFEGASITGGTLIFGK